MNDPEDVQRLTFVLIVRACPYRHMLHATHFVETFDLGSKDTVNVDGNTQLLLQHLCKLDFSCSMATGDGRLTRRLLSCLMAWKASLNLGFSAIGKRLASCFASTSQ